MTSGVADSGGRRSGLYHEVMMIQAGSYRGAPLLRPLPVYVPAGPDQAKRAARVALLMAMIADARV